MARNGAKNADYPMIFPARVALTTICLWQITNSLPPLPDFRQVSAFSDYLANVLLGR